MHKISLPMFAFILFSVSGFSAATFPNGQELLVKETSGGYTSPDHMGWGSKTTIFSNGMVFDSYRQNKNSPWTHTLIARIPTDIIAELSATVASLEPGDLSFPEQPECMDAPTTLYQAKNGQGIVVSFATELNCRMGMLETFYQGYRLMTILDGFAELLGN